METTGFSLPYKVSGQKYDTDSKLQQLTRWLTSMSGRLFVVFVLSSVCYLYWGRDWQDNQWNSSGNFILSFALVCTVVAYYFMSKGHREFEKQMQRMKTVSIATQAGIIKLMPREEWKAEPARNKLDVLQTPAEYVIISHSADIARLETTASCAEAVRKLQQLGFHMGCNDIAFNYLIGNDGVVYEGRGHSYVSATAKDWNQACIGIGFLGKFIEKLPSVEALDACKSYLQYLVDEGILTPNFTVYGLCQVRAMFPDAPGAMLYNDIQTWRGTGKNNTWSWRPKEAPMEDNEDSFDTDVRVT